MDGNQLWLFKRDQLGQQLFLVSNLPITTVARILIGELYTALGLLQTLHSRKSTHRSVRRKTGLQATHIQMLDYEPF